MALIDQYNTSQDSVFQRRIRMAILLTATQVSSESSGAANHANRAALAKSVLGSSDSFIQPFALAVCTNPAITLNSTDGDIEFTVNTIWDAMAGTGG